MIMRVMVEIIVWVVTNLAIKSIRASKNENFQKLNFIEYFDFNIRMLPDGHPAAQGTPCLCQRVVAAVPGQSP